MSTPPIPSADQLSAARSRHWRQVVAGDDAAASAVLTIEAARKLVSASGLLLFAPRPQQIGAPAPSLVEATLGTANLAPSLADTEQARTLLARLASEGSVVLLNLLGAPSTTPDSPDFIASTQVFPYLFTLRGDKAWKQPPSTSGATKVSPLALNTYTHLTENGPTSSYDLVTQLGKGLTEQAVLRALSELWQHLRVVPVPQPDGGPTLWELTSVRFTKQIKSGANAGQPTALSALISLYLGQSLLATEDEIETFLSPLAARSRVRDVLHALTAGRQLESIVIEGKHYLHVHGELPSFASPEPAPRAAETESDASELAAAEQEDAAAAELVADGDSARIRKFVPKPRKIGTGFVNRTAPGTGPRPSAGGDRERRPFRREGAAGAKPFRKPAGKFPGRSFPARSEDRDGGRPAFNKPWDEEKRSRPTRNAAEPSAGTPPYQDIDLDAGSQAGSSARPQRAPGRPPFGKTGAKRGFGGGDRPAYSRDRGAAPSDRGPSSRRPPFGDRQVPPRDRDGADRPARGPFKSRPEGGADTRPPRKPFEGKRTFSKGPGAGRGREDFAGRPARPPFRGSEEGGEGRPARRSFGDRPAPAGGDRPFRPRKPFTPRGPEGSDSRPPRRSFGDRPAPAGGDRPFRARKPFTPRGPEGSDARPPRRSFGDRPAPAGGDRPFRPRKPFTPRGPEGSDAPPARRSFSSGKPDSAGGPRRPFAGGSKRSGDAKSGGFGAKKSSGPRRTAPPREGAPDRPGSTFDKFKGGNKPWGKRPPARKPKPDAGEA